MVALHLGLLASSTDSALAGPLHARCALFIALHAGRQFFALRCGRLFNGFVLQSGGQYVVQMLVPDWDVILTFPFTASTLACSFEHFASSTA